MRVLKIYVSVLQILLFLLCLAPLAFALGPEKMLPEPCPGTGAAGGNTGNAAGLPQVAGPSIEDVWLHNGGARWYYSALYGPRQQYSGGASRLDPACQPLLPPLRAWGAPEPKKKATAHRRSVRRPANPCPEANKASAKASTAAAPSKTQAPKTLASSPRTKPDSLPAPKDSGRVQNTTAKPALPAGAQKNSSPSKP